MNNHFFAVENIQACSLKLNDKSLEKSYEKNSTGIQLKGSMHKHANSVFCHFEIKAILYF